MYYLLLNRLVFSRDFSVVTPLIEAFHDVTKNDRQAESTRGEPRESWSAYHLYGKHGNSKENSNGTVHPGGKFPEKK